MDEDGSVTFGPVPSRRLGRSMGINNIPPKICSYSCIYCQLGRTIDMRVERQPFYEPEAVFRDVREKVRKTRKAETEEAIDYLTFVPDGEPTLDANLGREIDLVQSLDIPVAVISNNSLLQKEGVREDLMGADWVSLKVDAVEEAVWRRINRPHKELDLDRILEGALEFGRSFEGKLMTETMLVEGVNDAPGQLGRVADFLARLQPTAAYLAIPTRPPAEEWAQPPDEGVINRAYQILREEVEHVEYLIGYEGDAFSLTGDVEEDLLNITAVHPMRKDAVEAFLRKAGAEWAAVRRLMAQDQLVEAEQGGHKFYLRRFSDVNSGEGNG